MPDSGKPRQGNGRSPSVARVVSILNLFFDQPQRPLTLTEVSRMLELSTATALYVLRNLVALGYLHRRIDKSYVLNLALLTLAARAGTQVSPVALVRRKLRALADELSVVATALERDGSRLAVLERAASVNHLDLVNRMPYGSELSPEGGLFELALSDAEFEAWLRRAENSLSAQSANQLRREHAFVRDHGFVAGIVMQPDNLTALSKGDVLTQVDADGLYRIRYMIAPIANGPGKTQLAISLFGFPQSMRGEDVLRAGHLLKETCDSIRAWGEGEGSAFEPRAAQG